MGFVSSPGSAGLPFVFREGLGAGEKKKERESTKCSISLFLFLVHLGKQDSLRS